MKNHYPNAFSSNPSKRVVVNYTRKRLRIDRWTIHVLQRQGGTYKYTRLKNQRGRRGKVSDQTTNIFYKFYTIGRKQSVYNSNERVEERTRAATQSAKFAFLSVFLRRHNEGYPGSHTARTVRKKYSKIFVTSCLFRLERGWICRYRTTRICVHPPRFQA